MALPTKAKTWQIVPNLYVPSTLRSVSCKKLIYGIKEALTGFALNPLTVVSSCWQISPDPPAYSWGTGDHWPSWVGIVWNNPGAGHAWIVLERVDGIQICFDCAGTGETSADIYVSLSDGFTGGTITNRPTASDEFGGFQYGMRSEGSSATWRGFHSDYGATTRYHVWNSTDGLIQRVVGFSRANTGFFWRFELVRDAPTGFSPPFIASVVCNSGGSSYPECLTSSDFLYIWGFMWQCRKGAFQTNGINSKLYNTSLRGAWPRASWAQVAEEIDNVLSLTDMAYFSRTDGTKGFKGRPYDLWVTNEALLSNGDSFPDDSFNRQFVCAGCVVLPWTGDGTSMMTA